MKMKNYILRYILPLFAIVASLHAQAQIESAPLIPMNSTSAMEGSGSNIPLAAESGTFAYDEDIVTIGKASAANGPRRVGGWDDSMPPGPVPIGSLPFLLMLLLCGGYVVVKKRQQSKLA